ncbi:MAG TPA: hypothetical protein VGK74_27470, partial [Symbiobacteriaceae bacterium]
MRRQTSLLRTLITAILAAALLLSAMSFTPLSKTASAGYYYQWQPGYYATGSYWVDGYSYCSSYSYQPGYDGYSWYWVDTGGYLLALGLSDPSRLSLSEPIGLEQNRGQGPGFVIQRVLARQSLRPQVVA